MVLTDAWRASLQFKEAVSLTRSKAKRRESCACKGRSCGNGAERTEAEALVHISLNRVSVGLGLASGRNDTATAYRRERIPPCLVMAQRQAVTTQPMKIHCVSSPSYSNGHLIFSSPFQLPLLLYKRVSLQLPRWPGGKESALQCRVCAFKRWSGN